MVTASQSEAAASSETQTKTTTAPSITAATTTTTTTNTADAAAMTTKETASTMTATKSTKAAATDLYRGVGLAPMVRASTTPLRVLALDYGADFVYTEELIDRALAGSIRVVNTRLNTIDYVKDTSKMSPKVLKRLEKSGGAPVMLRIDRCRERGKLILQLGTGDPDTALQAAQLVQQDVDAVDVNMGCPKRFSVKGGMGSALLSDPDRACRIISTLAQNLTVPVSAKIRLLKTAEATFEFIQRLVDAGAQAVAVHGRRVGDEATQPADWDTLRSVVKQAVSSLNVPILVNGDFYTRREWSQMMHETGASGVLLARPALYNCSLFCKPQASTTKQDEDYGYQSPLLRKRTAVIQDFVRAAVRYDTHYKNTKYVVGEMLSHRRTPTGLVPKMPQKFPGEQTIAKVCATHSLADLCRVWHVEYNDAVAARAAAVANGENKDTNTSTNTTTTAAAAPQQQAPAGEHTYSDSYFLNHEKHTTQSKGNNESSKSAPSPTTTPENLRNNKDQTAATAAAAESSQPVAKRMRVDQ